MFRPRKRKVFCIGLNKTGTTSLVEGIAPLGSYRHGFRPKADSLLEDWAKRDFRRIIQFCRTADLFKDIPFSLAHTYQALDTAFPGSKFILTVRDNPDEWFDSIVRYVAKICNVRGLPTPDDAKEALFNYKGFAWRMHELALGVDESTFLKRDVYVEGYHLHNRIIQDYFRHRPDDLLVMNVAEPDAMEKVCDFLGVPYSGQLMPHINRTA